MTTFDFVLVSVSIVLGLALSELLLRVARLINTWENVKPYSVHLLWVGHTLFLQLSFWWGCWALRNVAGWNFVGYAFLMFSTVVQLGSVSVALLGDATYIYLYAFTLA